MAQVIAKGIPTGAPILDPAAVWTPPNIGPLDGAHLWLAHSLRGLPANTKSLPDMIGTTNLAATSAAARFTDGEPPLLTISQGADAFISGATSDPKELTVLAVVDLVANKSAQLTVPGWVIGGGGTSRLTVSGSATATFGAAPQQGLAVYVLTLKAGAVTGYMNGQNLGSLSIAGPGNGSTYRLGTNVYTSSVLERYGAVKIWHRQLTAAEITAATADAAKLFNL